MTTTDYIRPDITNIKAVYKGRRYWVIEIGEIDLMGSYSKIDGDYLVWDGAYGTVIGGARLVTTNRYKCFVSTGQGCECNEATDYKGIAVTVVACAKSYMKHSFT